MTGAEIEVEAVKLLQFLDAPARRLLERRLAVKSVQHNAFQQIAQGQIVKFGQSLEHFEQTLFDTHSSLHALHHKLVVIMCLFHCGTNVPRYKAKCKANMDRSAGRCARLPRCE